MHRINNKSGDQVRLIKAPAQPTSDDSLRLTEHTDFGSMTVLFSRVGEASGTAAWRKRRMELRQATARPLYRQPG